jgi:hypothetical protein
MRDWFRRWRLSLRYRSTNSPSTEQPTSIVSRMNTDRFLLDCPRMQLQEQIWRENAIVFTGK